VHSKDEPGAADTVPMTVVDGAAPESATPEPERPSAPRVSRAPSLSDATPQGKRAVEERMQSLVGREQQAKFRRRLRSTLRIGSGLWAMFIVLDVVGVLRGLGRWEVYAVGRAIPLLAAFAMHAYLERRRDASVQTLRVLEAVIFPLATACTTVMVSQTGGWTTSRLPMVTLIVLGHGILLGTAWRRSIVPVGAMVLTVPIALGVTSLFRADMAAQLRDPAAMIEFGYFYAPIVGAAIISQIAGNTVYELRQELMEARSIGRYRLRTRIASGGMGEVWAAYHAGLKRDVAVKIMQPRLGEDETAVRRFEREVRAMAELTHPNTVRVFDYGVTEAGVWYFAMELLEAQDVESVIEASGPFTIERAVRILCQAADALGEAHQRGIVHRDVKPANLLLVNAGRKDEFVKLIDFGIAKIDDDAGLTSTGMVMGTPGYIAPEVANGQSASARADVFALGMTLYVMLTGAAPFEATTPMAILQRTVGEDAPPLRKARPDVPPALEAVVMQAISRDPLRRPRDAAALAEAVREAWY
jgi:serine/threonine-protein kinase